MPQTRASSRVEYKVFKGGPQVHEVASLEEFLASALSHKWIILLSLQKLPPPPNAWCPSLQPTLLGKGEIAKELKDRNCLKNLVVADVSEPLLQPTIKAIVAAESAFVKMQNLLQQLDASSSRKKIKSKKASTVGGKDALGDVRRVEQGIQGEDEEMLQQEDVLMADQTTAGKEKGGDEIAKDVVTAEDVSMAEQGTEGVTTTGKQEGGNGVKTQRDEGQPSRKEDDDLLFDKLFFEGGKIMHNGNQLSSLEMMVQFLKGMQGLEKGLQGLQNSVQDLQTGQRDLQTSVQDLQTSVQDLQTGQQDLQTSVQDLQTGQRDLQKEVQAIHKSLSSTGERVSRLSRLSLALLYGQYTGSRVEYPVTTRWIPYNPVAMNTVALEQLATLCKQHPKDSPKDKPSGLVEVDILMKIYKEDAGHKVYTSPMTVKTSRLLADRSSTCTHVVLGESSRSMDLCASAGAYKHPESPCRTSSTKLLKKLVQIERGIVATLHYYDAPTHGALVDAAAIISPSFRHLTDPDSLVFEVLSHTQALPNVARLARKSRMWLIDA